MAQRQAEVIPTRQREFHSGDFCWADLGTTDPEAAKRFYHRVFDWNVRDYPVGNGHTYSMLALRGSDVAALYPQCAEQRAKGIAPHWLPYVLVDDIESTAARARTLGAVACSAILDFPDVGRMAFVTDPTGASFALWENHSPSSHGVAADEPGSIAWVELATRDLPTSREFYGRLFGWVFEAEPIGDFTYYHILNLGRAIGGIIGMTVEWGDLASHWLVYFTVADCDRSVERAKASGASITVPPTDIKDVGRFALLVDPQGARLSFFQSRAL